ncbi:murein L,D-transpeptidase catalytic domain-containing protein [Chryseobacterium kwangjuense]|uniref:Peptidase n=1 Tax=Chryseobacterium kwangjuense TaxID=267125 RepID=A0A135W2F2_9FLAO|nr:murein L,D-transpeptidase catalytic domain family protein [Chryseobacterium kwangjuense]KXH79096.1 peptidase [Chryseobacterium kwangjuense]
MRIIALMLAVHLIYSCSQEPREKRSPVPDSVTKKEQRIEPDLSKIEAKAEEALKFCASKKFSTDFCILIDMSIHSGIKRFFVWDFKTKSVIRKYLVGHGCGSNPWSLDGSKNNPQFSNEDGSHLSSLGKYKLEGRGHSDWGINVKYLMHGLEETNSNALKRYIVFHSWDQMSDEEVFPRGSPEGWGCPTVSNNAMKEIDPMIQNSGKPVLMWIYE